MYAYLCDGKQCFENFQDAVRAGASPAPTKYSCIKKCYQKKGTKKKFLRVSVPSWPNPLSKQSHFCLTHSILRSVKRSLFHHVMCIFCNAQRMINRLVHLVYH